MMGIDYGLSSNMGFKHSEVNFNITQMCRWTFSFILFVKFNARTVYV